MTPRSEHDYRERPPSGDYSWPNNGDIYERMRCSLLVEADKAEAAGDSAKAEDLRGRAAFQAPGTRDRVVPVAAGPRDRSCPACRWAGRCGRTPPEVAPASSSTVANCTRSTSPRCDVACK